jgi:Ca2+-binding EF-hand superfamily protein
LTRHRVWTTLRRANIEFVVQREGIAMNPRSLRKVAAVLFMLLAPLAAYAQGRPPAAGGVDAFIQQWDPDKDGTLSLDEVKKAAEARFDALDKDKDGTLDAKELRGLVSKSEFTKLDPDKDGTLDKTEYQALVAQRFQAADPDKDGTLDKKELNSRAGKALMRLLQ